jgi:hypothetical protein
LDIDTIHAKAIHFGKVSQLHWGMYGQEWSDSGRSIQPRHVSLENHSSKSGKIPASSGSDISLDIELADMVPLIDRPIPDEAGLNLKRETECHRPFLSRGRQTGF